MKKILPCVLFVLALFSCKNDDEITVPACSEATNVQSQSIGIDQAVISWSDSNTDATFTVEYGPTGFVPGNGTLRDTNTNEVSLSGLDGNTTYDLYVQSNCSFENISSQTPAFSFTTLPELVVPQFSTNLSDMNIYVGDLDELNPSPYVFEYNLATSLFTDYGLKQRLLALPPGEKMNFVDADLPNFPDNTVITKTFYYNFDENDPAAGRQIIETRVIIKMNGEWELGTYHWNAEQTDAVLNPESVTVPISYSNQEGETVNINYIIPGAADCFTCHNINGAESPIGPKMRTMNFNGQLNHFINTGYLDGLPDESFVAALPEWEDETYSLEERARAYLDVNCAHCHREGGYCEDQSTLRLLYETSFDDSNIFARRFSIRARMQTVNPGWSMPLLGTTVIHAEGLELIEAYLDSLE